MGRDLPIAATPVSGVASSHVSLSLAPRGPPRRAGQPLAVARQVGPRVPALRGPVLSVRGRGVRLDRRVLRDPVHRPLSTQPVRLPGRRDALDLARELLHVRRARHGPLPAVQPPGRPRVSRQAQRRVPRPPLARAGARQVVAAGHPAARDHHRARRRRLWRRAHRPARVLRRRRTAGRRPLSAQHVRLHQGAHPLFLPRDRLHRANARSVPAVPPRPGRGRARIDGHRAHGSHAGARLSDDAAMPPNGDIAVTAPFAGTVIAIAHEPDEPVRAGAALVVLEAMKMEHEVVADADGVLSSVEVAIGDTVDEGQVLAHLAAGEASADAARSEDGPADPAAPPADLDAGRERHAGGLDDARGDAVARRREQGRRTARENLDDLVDGDTFVEYGPLVFAAQERRRSREELIARTPADGLVAGVGDVDGAPTVVLSYDYMVLAGTQGMRNHLKKDRLFEIAERRRLPVVLFAEGGGGRPGDVDMPMVAGLDCRAFHLFGRLSGAVPMIGIASGYCFAGNAALLGTCDVVIATEDSSIGMGGPAMIEGGGLGVFEPADVGPIDVQDANGVVDLRVAGEAEAVAAAKRYLGYFRGPVEDFEEPDPRALRHLIPEQRKRAYDVRAVVDALFDAGSVLELRRGFGLGMVTALARSDGRPLGVVANDPTHLGGAIDAHGADKAARFLQLCDAFELPVLFLCDTPGFMVGPAAERTATVRHFGRMFVVGANLTVPTGTIVLRKGYGLGAQAMAGGGFKAPLFCVGWPTSEFGGMGLEGAVRLGMRRELEAIDDPAERERAFEAAVAGAYEHGKGINMAAYGEIDDVIDPADSRRWIAMLFDETTGDWHSRPALKKRPN